MKTFILAGTLLFSLSAGATAGYPGHSQTAGPETTDVMGGGTPGGQGTEHSGTNAQRSRVQENTQRGTGAITDGESGLTQENEGYPNSSRSDTENYDQRLRGEESGAHSNSQQRMEERQNNSNVIYDSDRKTPTDGRDLTRKDSRNQGEEYNRDTSDFEVEEEEE